MSESALHAQLSALYEANRDRTVKGLMSDIRFADLDRTADASVLIAVRENATRSVVLTQRPTTMRDHPGQVAFPGGKRDDGETAIEAALREAEEELAMDRAAVRVIGPLDRYQTGTGFDITPVLATIPADLPLKAEPREVESWFETPLDVLMDSAGWQRNSVFWKGAMRDYIERDYSGYRIWGVTAAICHNMALRLGLEAG